MLASFRLPALALLVPFLALPFPKPNATRPGVRLSHHAPAPAVRVSTLAGSDTDGGADGKGAAAQLAGPQAIAYDGQGSLYVVDMAAASSGPQGLRKIATATGVVSTLVGGSSEHVDGIGTGVACDDKGSLYVIDGYSDRLYQVGAATGAVKTLLQYHLISPMGVAYDGKGNLYVTEFTRIRKVVFATGEVTTLAGSNDRGFADGQGAAAKFNMLEGIACDGKGNLYVSDRKNSRIRKVVAATGVVTTLAGSGTEGFANGPGTAAQFNSPHGVACDGNGDVYVADRDNHRIRKVVAATGVVTTLAGSGTIGFADGPGTAARFNYPSGVACDASGIVYVADRNNNRIRMIK
jgi:sugar lactone lactonase YvrE